MNVDAPVGQIFPISRAAIMYRVLAEEVMAVIESSLVEAVS